MIFVHKILPNHIFILLYPEADRLIFGAMFWQLILSQIFWGPTKWLMAWSTVINGSLNIVRKFKFIDGFNWEGCQKDPFSRLLLLRSPPFSGPVENLNLRSKSKCCGEWHRSWNGLYTWNNQKKMYKKTLLPIPKLKIIISWY